MKFKVGDKVKLVAWNSVDNHREIEKSYWDERKTYNVERIDECDQYLTYLITNVNDESDFIWVSERMIEAKYENIGKIFDFGLTTWEIVDILNLQEDWYVCKSADEYTAATYRKAMVDELLRLKKAKYEVGDRVAIRPMVFTAIRNDFYNAIKGIWIGKISSCEVKNGKIVYTVDFGKCGVDVEFEEENIAGLFESFDTDELINTFVTKDEEVERLRERMNFFMYYIGFLEGDKKITPLRFPKACEYAREYTFGDWISVNRFIHDKHLNLKKKG